LLQISATHQFIGCVVGWKPEDIRKRTISALEYFLTIDVESLLRLMARSL